VDRRDALFRAVTSSEPIDVFVGDWMSELNMPSRAFSVVKEGEGAIGYEPSYLQALEPALEKLAERRIKFVANGGCVATKDLFDQVLKMIKDKGLEGKLNVAWVEGDIVTDVIKAADRSQQISVCTGQKLSEWPHEPIFAQCYLGGWAIAKALEAGADIVLCGRVADASPIIGAATWWHNWKRTDFDCLAQTLIAGHLIECKSRAEWRLIMNSPNRANPDQVPIMLLVVIIQASRIWIGARFTIWVIQLPKLLMMLISLSQSLQDQVV
jgi:hypothetical protein